MARKRAGLFGILAALSFILLPLSSFSSQQPTAPVDYVNPLIGGIGNLLNGLPPTVQLPHAMMRIAPVTTPGITDPYLADKIYGFPAGGVLLMPVVGTVAGDPAQNASEFDHDLETVTPYYYAVTLEKDDVVVEYTVSEQACHYRIVFPKGTEAHVLFTVRAGGEIKQLDSTALAGQYVSGAGRSFFHAELSRPVTSSSVWHSTPPHTSHGLVTTFAPAEAEQISIRIGMSYISSDQARRNLLREIPGWDFDQLKQKARAIWNRALSQIEVKGGTDEERTVFYTALYRTLSRMTDITEDGKYYSPYDNKIHSAEGRHAYTNDGLWDTYRSAHPLQLILDPHRQEDMVRSYLNMYDQSGWLPTFPSVSGGQQGMIGHHTIALITDTYMKGYRDFDVAKAYEAMKKMAMQATMLSRKSGPLTPLDRVYLEKGFFPALAKGENETVREVDGLERRQAVSVTLEISYDDWCLAQMAKLLGKSEDYAYFTKRAHNYENVFDGHIGFMAPKSSDGRWVEEYDPKYSGGWGGRDYFAESNGWNYTFHVQHDVAGLARLMGGRKKLSAKLDALFVEQWGPHRILRWPDDPENPRAWMGARKYDFLGQWGNMTGLIGNFAQGNEPSFHIPYLYNYVGEPWKTQRRLREIMKVWYNAGPLGICGDEDGGAMSSWYVLSAMGFYPVCPGRPVYDIGSPIFEETRIALENGKIFTVIARDVSAKNKYIQRAELNGKTWARPWFEHSDLINGGTLILQMGPRPNKAWGSTPEAAPPSMSQ